ncbi:MAG: DUF2817 domain-containing protein [Polaribacter sp.]|nr:DUF2817 domain-containing protein [Polaribacter sp.]
MKPLSLPLLEAVYRDQKETTLFGKWIHYADISPLIHELSNTEEVLQIGTSEDGLPIHSVQFGTGKKKILIWTQMHGNESTGTKALFDLFNCFNNIKSNAFTTVLKECTILCIPMLNPDGAYQYTRVNANNVDLNRDAIAKIAKESRLLRGVLDTFQPQFCFNLHDQRTIFGVKGTENPATLSFLAPSEEITRKITTGRKETMDVIVAMNSLLQEVIPNHIGRYTDEFYPTATGDTFQKLGHNTILIEAGHYPDDYDREVVRKFNFFALIQGLYHIAVTSDYTNYKSYFEIPNNQKNFFDIIERNLDTHKDVAYQYEDHVLNNKLINTKKRVKEGELSNYLAHRSIIIKK